MPKESFSDIRERYPGAFLLLLDYDEQELPGGRIEITAAEKVYPYASGEEMLDGYQQLRRSHRRRIGPTGWLFATGGGSDPAS